MENAINTLRIQNFKSIKEVTMQPRRVNLLIGMPNVGKSNVLEALSLLGAGLYQDNRKFLGDVLRYETVANLFYDNDTSQPVIVNASTGRAVLRAKNINNGGYEFVQIAENIFRIYKDFIQKDNNERRNGFDVMKEDEVQLLLDFDSHNRNGQDSLNELKKRNEDTALSKYSIQEQGDFNNHGTSYFSNLLFKKYIFRSLEPHNLSYRFSFLKPPHGHNLLEVVQRNSILRKEIVELFKPYNLKMVLRVGERKFEIQKEVEGFVYNYPYSLIADTLQRIIFYLAAIESNDDSVLLFEEPEAHTFPVYTSMLGRKIVESKNNQFFVATHSPYLVTEILEQMLPFDNQLGELAIFLAYYEDYQTKIHQLTDEEIKEIRNDSIDVFYNLSRFTPGSNLYA